MTLKMVKVKLGDDLILPLAAQIIFMEKWVGRGSLIVGARVWYLEPPTPKES